MFFGNKTNFLKSYSCRNLLFRAIIFEKSIKLKKIYYISFSETKQNSIIKQYYYKKDFFKIRLFLTFLKFENNKQKKTIFRSAKLTMLMQLPMKIKSFTKYLMYIFSLTQTFQILIRQISNLLKLILVNMFWLVLNDHCLGKKSFTYSLFVANIALMVLLMVLL